MQFVPLVAAIALIWKIVDFAKLVRARDVNGIVTQAVVWVAGVAIFFLLASTDYATGIRIGGVVLAHLNGPSLILIGLSAGSSAAVGYDFKRAVDHSDSATMPPLIPTAPSTITTAPVTHRG